MSESAGTFFIELSSLFNPKGFETADKKMKESSASFGSYFNNLTSKSNAWAGSFSAGTSRISQSSQGDMGKFFDITSNKFLNLESLTKGVFDNILNSFISTLSNMASQAMMSGVFGLLGGGGSLLGGLLGGRRSGGPIGKTGPYLLHEGEFVLPPELVRSIKESRTPSVSSQSLSGGQESTAAGPSNLNITINTPVSLQGSGTSAMDAKRLCEEISAAARRGVVWAVEQAKISYKIGKQKSGESSI